MKVAVKAQVDAHLSVLKTSLEDMNEGTNPTRVKEILAPFWLELNVDKFVTETVQGLHGGTVDKNIFNAEIEKEWLTYSQEEGGAVPSEIVCDQTMIVRRIIYLNALAKAFKE